MPHISVAAAASSANTKSPPSSSSFSQKKILPSLPSSPISTSIATPKRSRHNSVSSNLSPSTNAKAKAVPKVPQHVLNALVKSQIAVAEADITTSITRTNAQIDYNVTRYTAFLAAKDDLVSLSTNLNDAKNEAVESYVHKVAVKNDACTRSKLEMELKAANFDAYSPEWLKLLNSIKYIVKEHGYSNKTRWRSAVGEILRKATRLFIEKHGGEEGKVGVFKRMALSFNSYGPQELPLRITSLSDFAGDVEGKKDATFELLRLEYRMARDAWVTMKEELVFKDVYVVEARAKKERLQVQGRADRETLGLSVSTSKLLSTSTSSSSSSVFDSNIVSVGKIRTSRSEQRKDRQTDASDVTKAELKQALRLPVTKDNAHTIQATYNNLFAYCASSGDSLGSIEAYIEYTRQGFKPNKYTFQCMITACKRANPPEVDRAVLILDDMRRQQVQVSISHYNAIIDTCRAGGNFRRGVQVFEAMNREGLCKPNTNTYSLMAKLGFEAENDDAGEIYEALKYAGVPEFVAYTSAASNALREKPKQSLKEKRLEEQLRAVRFVELPVALSEMGDGEGGEEEASRREERVSAIEKAVESLLNG